MSSTQHQLIEQCAIRLRGIVEALDNIHDNTPHRWSTDLDDVHSSAESLLALIKDQAPARSEASFEEWLANELEGEDGQPVPAAVCDIALARRAFNHWPKLEQPAKVGGVRFSAGVSSRLVVEAAQRLYEFGSTPEKEAERIDPEQESVEQAGGDERAAFDAWLNEVTYEENTDRGVFKVQRHQTLSVDDERIAWRAWQGRALLARSEQEEMERLREAYEWGYGDGQNSPNGYSDKKERDACVNELLKQPSTAQAEAARLREENANLILTCASLDSEKREMQHKWDAIIAERDAALAEVERLRESKGDPVGSLEKCMKVMYERDENAKRLEAALARVAELEHVLQVVVNAADHGSWPTTVMYGIEKVREVLAGSGAPSQAQHSVPDVCDSKEQNAFEEWASKEGMNMERHPLHWLFLDAKTYSARQGWKAALKYARNMLAAAPVCRLSRSALTEAQMRRLYENSTETENERLGFEAFARLIRRAEAVHQIAAAPGKEVPQAWLDVQAERRRQVEAEGWTPEHDDEHSHGQMARASACYALAGSSAPNDGTAALLVSLAWPWDEQWWKPSTARRDLVKACALVLAEIERLDRAAASQGGPSDA
ncbi:hypothetical protein AAIH29_14450 [Pseudomonas aeruginosa]|uniref:hypothetical protein n=1 Tax=Pseudomonas aeruginosa TaxID=287 RepID=UPI0031B6BB7A